jgi:hypothetical protein
MSLSILRTGARVIMVIILLFGLAYVCFVAAVCATLKRSRLALEQDYPLCTPPDDKLTDALLNAESSR